MALHDCTNNRRRLLRGDMTTPTPTPSARILTQATEDHSPEHTAATNSAMDRAVAAADVYYTATGRYLATASITALSLGSNTSMVGFNIDTIAYAVAADDDDAAVADAVLSGGCCSIWSAIIIIGGVLLCGIFGIFALNRRRVVGHPARNVGKTAMRYAPVAHAAPRAGSGHSDLE